MFGTNIQIAAALVTLSTQVVAFASAPAPKPDPVPEGAIAFVHDSKIWVMGPDGKDRKALIDGQSPSWSPDGKRIAYRHKGLWVMDPDGSNSRRLTEHDPGTFCWSPDGRRIVYWSQRRLCVIAADGTEARQLLEVRSGGYSCCFSPDGKKVLFAYRADATKNSQIFVCDADGKNLRQLTNGVGDYDPIFSPDGKSIVFSSLESGQNQLRVMDSDGGNRRKLTHADRDELSKDSMGVDGTFSFSPDGNRIVFIYGDRGDFTPDGRNNVWIIDKDGKNLKRLTNQTPAAFLAPTFTAEGKILFSSYPMSRDGAAQPAPAKIYTVETSGKNLTCLGEGSAPSSRPQRSPR
jgi:Tol biopolymer transport system component